MAALHIRQGNLFTRRFSRALQPSPKEHQLQIQLVTLLKWAIRPDVIFLHCPNGEVRDKVTAAKLRAMGVLPGVSDLMFFWATPKFRALFLELKRPGAKLTTEQAAFGLAMRVMGADFEVATSVDEALEVVRVRGLLRPDREIRRRT
jgi:hypothetical protein